MMENSNRYTRPTSIQLRPSSTGSSIQQKLPPKFYRSSCSTLTPLNMPSDLEMNRNGPPRPPSAIVLNNVSGTNGNFRSVILIKNTNTIFAVPHTVDEESQEEIIMKKFKKSDIEKPINFRHVKHVSGKPNEDFDRTALEDEIKKAAGRRNDSIDIAVEDPEHRTIIQNYLESQSQSNPATVEAPAKIKNNFFNTFMTKIQRKKSNISKSDIGLPTNFRHIKHVGANLEQNFDHS